MNVLWTKEKQKMFSGDSISLHAHASGDGGGTRSHCCRLCGGENSLRGFGESYVWEGVQERYDQLLYDCFGVQVHLPSESMICEWCVRQLRNTERFRALVYAAFDKPDSEGSTKTLKTSKPGSKIYSKNKSIINDESTINNKSIVELQRNKVMIDSPKKREVRRKITNVKPTCKRANFICRICQRKYTMMVPENCVDKKFVCSRCKKNGGQKSVCKKCNDVIPTNMLKEHIELHAKSDLRGKCRLRSQPKNPQQVKDIERIQNGHIPKYQCSQCPKRYVLAQHLESHIRSIHGDQTKFICSVCGKDLLNALLLENHMRKHNTSSKYKCVKCL